MEGNRILIGTERLFYAKGVELNQELNNLKRIREEEGNTVVHLSVNEIHSAILTLADTLKESTPATIEKLKSLDIEVYMITGDNERTARVISKDCGIERVLAEVLPEKKAMEVKNLKKFRKKWFLWWGTELTMLLRLRFRILGLLWEPERMWQWNLPI